MNSNTLKLGSLFDGIGAFPYAASFFGIAPIWASEISSNSISITKKHFPDMAHLGDITKLNGGEIPPVDILCIGSPCQSFSVAAGVRTGFEGKSGLFNEAARIIQEMRCATNGKYPQIVCFENVPGLLNCNAGRDYQAVISAFCETEIPMPSSGKWANAGMVRGGRVDYAWIVKDAQHYNVPQRRKRLFAIADYSARRAAEILFESERLSRHFAAHEGAGQDFTADAENGTGSTGRKIAGIETPIYCLQGNMIGRTDENGPQGIGISTGICYTLSTVDRHAIAYADGAGNYVVRRLTPLENERLMSFVDGYTAVGHDGRVMSDSVRYQMLGNSIVVNVLAYIMQNIAVRLCNSLCRSIVEDCQ